YEAETLVKRFEDIKTLSAEEATEKYAITQGVEWVRAAKTYLNTNKEIQYLTASVRPLLYRPFDMRYTLYGKGLIERGDHRYSVMRHLLHENLSLLTTRITKEPFAALACRGLSEHKASVRYDGSFVFPLWLYPEEG
ncbi:MAG: DNA methyltransferase, partial [Armatimonadetes bacterium]|nr:DNA methyltransferase [Armatimonadota bacterium]